MNLSVKHLLFCLLAIGSYLPVAGQEKAGSDSFATAKLQRPYAVARTLRTDGKNIRKLQHSPQQQNAPAVLRNISAKTQLYGTVIYADNWTATSSDFGIYAFRASVSPGLEKKMAVAEADGMAGDYVEGKYCYFDYKLYNNQVIEVNYHIVDPVTWTQTSLSKNSSLCACSDVTYDRISKKMYGCSPYTGSAGSALVEIDPANGDVRYLAPMPYMLAMASDAAGTLFGIYMNDSGEGMLCRINTLTGDIKDIGSTELKIGNFLQSATIDYDSNTLYWATTTAEETGVLYKVDPTTGQASYLAQFPENEEITGIGIPGEAFPDEAPNRVEELKAIAPDPEIQEATLTFTAPRTCVDGTPLTELTRIDLYRATDTEPIHSFARPEPGAPCSWTDRTPTPGINTYRVIPVNDKGAGPTAFTWVYVGVDLPTAVKNLTVTLTGEKPVITWEAPETGVNGQQLNPGALTYTVERVMNEETVPVAENITATTFTDSELELAVQSFVYYRVTAISAGGSGVPALSRGILYGPAYRLTFYESFPEQQTACSPWKVDFISGNAEWELAMFSNFPGATASDGDYGLAVFNSFHAADGSQARLCSPKIALENARNPVLRFDFYYYQLDEDLFHDELQIEIAADGGEYLPVPGARYQLSDYNLGWTTIEVPLTAYKNTRYISIGFLGTSAYGANLLVDRIIVKDKMDNDMEMLSLTGPARIQGGTKAVFRTIIYNNGTSPASDYTVELKTTEKNLASFPGTTVNPDQPNIFTFSVPIPVGESGRELTCWAEIVSDTDENPDNNRSELLTFPVVQPPFSVPDGLTAVKEGENVRLNWNEPVITPPGRTTDDFEFYEAFSIGGIGGYTLYDKDRMPTVTFEGNYPNEGSPMAFMVFNPRMLGATGSVWDAYSGDQYLACFSAKGAPNDDWLISPELPGQPQTLSFMARSINDDYSPERFQVSYSTAGKEPGDFLPLSKEPYEEAPTAWTAFTYDLPEGSRYFAIHCISSDQSVFMIDDVSYTPAPCKPTGYNIYVNTERINETPVTATSYLHEGILPSTLYTYRITAVYPAGESALSEKTDFQTSDLQEAEAEFPLKIRSSSGRLEILNPTGTAVVLYTPEGKILYRTSRKETTIQGLQPGVYLIKAGNRVKKTGIF